MDAVVWGSVLTLVSFLIKKFVTTAHVSYVDLHSRVSTKHFHPFDPHQYLYNMHDNVPCVYCPFP